MECATFSRFVVIDGFFSGRRLHSIMPSFLSSGALSTMTILFRAHQNVGLFRISRVNSFLSLFR